jgi:acetyl-CoA acetyltransferase
MTSKLKDKYAIAGIGHTDYSTDSGRTEFELALEAIRAAVEDAGLEFKDIDGIVGDHPGRVAVMDIASALGLPELGFFIETEYAGGGAPASVVHAIAGMEGGRAAHVLCYKALNGASKNSLPSFAFSVEPYELGFTAPFGLSGPHARAALSARRHMHLYGTTGIQFGEVAVACRAHALRNPNAVMRDRPMSIDDHQSSDMIADPLRRLDCFTEADGAAALVITSVDRAKDLKQPPAYVMAASQACNASLSRGIKDPAIMENETRLLGRELFRMAGVSPDDIDVLQIYDEFTPYVIMALEDLGFCGKGEGGALVEQGQIQWPDGKFPLNTSGGNLSEGCIEGFNHIIEAVKQMRGTSHAQVADAELALVCGATDVPTSGLILGRQRCHT